MQFFSQPSDNPAIGFDYDCSGNIERDPDLNKTVDCASLLGLGCDDAQGFVGSAPSCGQMGDWGTCKEETLSCKTDSITERTMQCH